MRSAKIQPEVFDLPFEYTDEDRSSPSGPPDAGAELKRQVAERLAAHRARRGRQMPGAAIPIAAPKPRNGRANRIASAVADRYAQTQSYRDFLAAEAQRAIDNANAAAEIAARNAEAVTEAQQQLLAELDLWADSAPEGTDEPVSGNKSLAQPPAPVSPAPTNSVTKTITRDFASGLTVRLYEDVGVARDSLDRVKVRVSAPTRAGKHHDHPHLDQNLDWEESLALDEEIAFRQSPVFEEPAGPPVPIPANLIEFPRQLVATRKARPRIAEGPLREEADAAPAAAQLRIFEVEASQISTAPSGELETSFLPEWSSIHLDAVPAAAPIEAAATPEPRPLVPMLPAPLSLRAMSALVDGCILGVAFLAAVCAFTLRVSELPSLPVAAMAGVATVVVLSVLYHLLFFTFSDATPGMRYARVGLCTFGDENPTRAEMRRRTWAVLLAALPLGMGFLWAWLDEEGLGWHDRISRMYQRSY